MNEEIEEVIRITSPAQAGNGEEGEKDPAETSSLSEKMRELGRRSWEARRNRSDEEAEKKRIAGVRASWTPERRKAQAEKMREVFRKKWEKLREAEAGKSFPKEGEDDLP